MVLGMEILWIIFVVLILREFTVYTRATVLADSMKYTPKNVYGGAAWATEKMLRAAGLFKKRGLPLGYWRKGWWWKEIFFDGRTHLITFGGTGKGKTTQALIPAAMRWAFSAVFL